MPAFTPRNVAKFVAKAIVHGKTAQLAENAITNHTNLDEDSIAADIGGHLIGWYVSLKLQPYTDAMVDKAADWYVARKADKTITE